MSTRRTGVTGVLTAEERTPGVERTAGRYVRGIAVGCAYIVVALLLAWAASSDRTPVSWIAPYAFFITLAWWIAVTLGVAAAISSADRVSVGVIVAVLAIPAMVVSMGLMQRVEPVTESFGTYAFWQSAVLTAAAPWLFGTAFGWSVVYHRHRHDPVSRG